MNIVKTTHKEDCSRIFKRYDIDCPRCQELASGAEARQGWNIQKYNPVYKVRSCSHGIENLNPGGYCIVCGAGSDHS